MHSWALNMPRANFIHFPIAFSKRSEDEDDVKIFTNRPQNSTSLNASPCQQRGIWGIGGSLPKQHYCSEGQNWCLAGVTLSRKTACWFSHWLLCAVSGP